MRYLTGKTINIFTNVERRNDEQNICYHNSVVVDVFYETEKRVYCSRIIKGKEYTCWILRSSIKFLKKDEKQCDDNVEIKAKVKINAEMKFNSYMLWFFNC